MKKTVLVLVMAMMASPVMAENSKPVWSTDYDLTANSAQTTSMAQQSQNYAEPKSNVPPPPQPKYANAQGRKSVVIKRGGNADGAWTRQWTPIQNITGVSSGQAKDFIQGVKQRYADGTQKTLSSAQDWALILGESGLIGTVTDSTSLWFNYVATDVPSALAGGQGGSFASGLMGGMNGFGGYPAFMNSQPQE